MTIFVSGATGYIGAAILRRLALEGEAPLGSTRTATPLPPGITPLITGDLAEPGLQLPPITTAIHAAGLGHRRGVSPKTWRRANVDAAVNLALAARAAGAKKFILISTAYIHGRTHPGMVTDTTPPNPADAYAESKLQAEHDVAAAFGPGLVIIRPVAVIGPAAPGNIPILLKLLARKIPLPFAGIDNKRSFIHRDDLAGIVLAAVQSPHPPASILAAHPETISTPNLIRALAAGLNTRARLFNCPENLLKLGAALTGRAALWQSLSGSFIPNPAAARALGWQPALNLEETLAHTARYYHTTAPKP